MATPAGELFLPSMPDALYASELIGMDVYSSATDYAAEYGDRTVEPMCGPNGTTSARSTNCPFTGRRRPRRTGRRRRFPRARRPEGGARHGQIHVLRDEADESFAAVTSCARRSRPPRNPAGYRPDAGVAAPETSDATAYPRPGIAEGAFPPDLEREGFMTAEYDKLTAEELEDAPVYDANDENIGSLEELILSQDGKIEQAIVDVGGFLGMGEHRIGLAFDEMQVMTNADNSEVRVYIDQTRETLEQRPEYQQ